MKTRAILIIVSLTLLTITNALFHRVIISVKRSGQGTGIPLEMKTFVQFFGTPETASQDENNVPGNSIFPGSGRKIFDFVFGSDPSSILVRVTEDDGAGTSKDDAVCRFIVDPVSFPVGVSKYNCYRDRDNGLANEWHVVMTMTSFIPIF